MGIGLISSALITEISIFLAIQFMQNFAIFVFNNIQHILISFVFMLWINNKIIKYIIEFMMKNKISILFALLLSNVSLEIINIRRK